jgi:hypothetical protein
MQLLLKNIVSKSTIILIQKLYLFFGITAIMIVTVRVHRRINLFTRFIVGLFSAISLGFFITNLFHVFDANFWPDKPGISTLIVGAVRIKIISS